MINYQQMFEANRLSWNKRTGVHKDSAFYNLASFKNGKTSLTPVELNELGDVKGKALLHLQCHFGLDTMSWEREGAIVTGVDISDEAINLANQVKTEIGSSAEFICCNVYDLKQHLNKKFDIVFTSYGTIGWLPNLDKWAGIVSHFLKPGGTFYIADFHPVLWMMDDNFKNIQYDYFNSQVISEEISGSYTDRNAPIKSIEHSWNHSFSEILNSLIKHGLQIVQLNEFPFSPYNCFNNLEKGQDEMWRIIEMKEKIPMMYSIKATKRI